MKKLTEKQIECFEKIIETWRTKERGVYVDKKISRQANELRRLGLVEFYPYTKEYGWNAYPCEGIR